MEAGRSSEEGDDSCDARKLTYMDSVSNRLIFGPKCKTFGEGKQLMKIGRSLQKKAEWRLVSIMLAI